MYLYRMCSEIELTNQILMIRKIFKMLEIFYVFERFRTKICLNEYFSTDIFNLLVLSIKKKFASVVCSILQMKPVLIVIDLIFPILNAHWNKIDVVYPTIVLKLYTYVPLITEVKIKRRINVFSIYNYKRNS